MPSPAIVQAAIPSAMLTWLESSNVSPAMPANMTESPTRTNRRPGHLPFILAWNQAPLVHASVAPVTAIPATTGV